jgi:hypothetical protein
MRYARWAAGLAVLLVACSFGVDALADATQTRPDDNDANERTEIVLQLASKHYQQGLATGAVALWTTCSATVRGALVAPGIVDDGNGQFRFSVHPSLGRQGKERLTGCLRDLTIERLRAHVVSVSDEPYAEPSSLH